MSESGFAFAAEHSRDFLGARFAFHLGECGDRAACDDVFAHYELRPRRRRDLREVGDGENLALSRDGAHFCSDRVGDLAADVGIYFVED